MIHISELAWRWVSTPDKVVQPGMFVRAKVVGVDREKARINLSLKQMEVGYCITHFTNCFSRDREGVLLCCNNVAVVASTPNTLQLSSLLLLLLLLFLLSSLLSSLLLHMSLLFFLFHIETLSKKKCVSQDDPLTETLDDLVPLDASNSIIAVPTCVPEAVEDICAALSELDAINSVTLGRQAQEKAVVSQVRHCWCVCAAAVVVGLGKAIEGLLQGSYTWHRCAQPHWDLQHCACCCAHVAVRMWLCRCQHTNASPFVCHTPP